MANGTATWLKLGEEREGRLKVTRWSCNITAAGTEGIVMTAGTDPFSMYRNFKSVEVSAGETQGYVPQFIPTTLPGAKGSVGDGTLEVFEAGADSAALDEVTTGDLGVFFVTIRGW